jgi:hypothetical protein
VKTALSIVGIVFLVLLAFSAVVIGAVVWEGTRLDASSKAYVDENVPLIVKNWSQEELSRRESAQFRAVTSDDQLAKLFSIFSQLGPMQEYGTATGGANMNMVPASGFQVTAVYTVSAEFQNGKAEIRIALVKKGDSWEISGFRVDSPAFLKSS